MANPNKEALAGASAPSKFISAIFNSKVPAGLKLTQFEWENEYRGTDAAFLESGLIKPEWMPGQYGNPKGKVAVGLVGGEMAVLPKGPFPTNDQFDNGFIIIHRSSKGRLKVSVYCLKKEREKREDTANLVRQKKRTEETGAEIDKSLAELPSSPVYFIHRQLHTVRSMTHVLRTSLVDGFGYSGGYRFSSDVVAAFDVAAGHLIQLIQEADTRFDGEIRQKEIADIQNRVLAKYPGLTDKDIAPMTATGAK